jgi:hypothetical protein
MGVGFGIGPNGQFGPVITFDGGSTASRPSSYDYTFETTDGIQVDVTVNTENESRAETIRKDMEEKLGLKSIEAPDGPATLAGAFGWALLIGFLAFVIVPLLVGFGATILHAAGLIQVDILDYDFPTGRFFSRIALAFGGLGFTAGLIGGIADWLDARHEAAKAAKQRF